MRALGHAIVAHFARIEAAGDPFSSAPEGHRLALYSRANLLKPIGTPGWARLWLEHDGEGSVIAHASAYALSGGDPDMVSGDIVVEAEHRRRGVGARLQAAQARWLDEHGLTLAGPIVPGNEASLRSHLAVGYEPLRVDHETGDQWVVRWPRGQGKAAR